MPFLTSSDEFVDEMRVTVIATGFEQKAEESETKTTGGMKSTGDGDIDEIFNIFNR